MGDRVGSRWRPDGGMGCVPGRSRWGPDVVHKGFPDGGPKRGGGGGTFRTDPL